MTSPIRLTDEPEYVLVQPGLGGVAWLGEVIDGELSPIGKVSDILAAERALVERLDRLAAEWETWAATEKARAERMSGDRRQPYLTNAAFYETHARCLRAALAPSSTENREDER